MAKKKKAPQKNGNKSINPKIIRAIRLTLASVFLISAIVVAAIPPGELEARREDFTAGGSGVDHRGNANYDNNINTTPESVNTKPTYGSVAVSSSSFYDYYHEKSDYINWRDYQPNYPDLRDPYYDGDDNNNVTMKTSYTVVTFGGTDYLVDRFRYGSNESLAIPTNAILYKYLNVYGEQTIDFSDPRLSNEYFTVSSGTFDDFYSEKGPGGKTYIYSYDLYEKLRNSASLTHIENATHIILSEFWKDDFDRKKREFDQYWSYIDLYNLWNSAFNQWSIDNDWNIDPQNIVNFPYPSGTPLYPAKPDINDSAYNLLGNQEGTQAMPDPLNRNPSVLRDVEADGHDKMRFYCFVMEQPNLVNNFIELEFLDTDATVLPYLDYRLHKVFISMTDRPSWLADDDWSSMTTYLLKAAGGQPAGLLEWGDNNGFLVKYDTDFNMLVGIGNDAFNGIKDVQNIKTGPSLRYIGDRAFYDSFINTIDLSGVAYIGNQSFSRCPRLGEIILGTFLEGIGTEAFSYLENASYTILPLTGRIKTIGPGAFAECRNIKTIDFGTISEAEVHKYAFYNCTGLDDVKWNNNSVKSLGDAVFAVRHDVTGTWGTERGVGANGWPVGIQLPSDIAEEMLGNYLFEGRKNLIGVTMPASYGRSENVLIPSGIFRDCFGLQFVVFPDSASRASFLGYEATNGTEQYQGYLLFYDASTEPGKEFTVYGPGSVPTAFDPTGYALPRQSTWKAFTANSNYMIPYIYMDGGEEQYEVSQGDYLLRANDKGELSKITLLPDASEEGRLVIPKVVGKYRINTITKGVLNDPDISAWIKEVIMQDGDATGPAVQTIKAGAFEGLVNLRKVTISNSITLIEEDAFKNCENLNEIIFNPPDTPYSYTNRSGLEIEKDAFLTNTISGGLTFYGEIDDRYAAFNYAMDFNDGFVARNTFTGEYTGLRIRYKGLLGSGLLTVMIDNETGENVLLDYPRFDTLDTDNKSFIENQQRNYESQYDLRENTSANQPHNNNIKRLRREFVEAYISADTFNYDDAYNDNIFGPWITRSFLNSFAEFIAKYQAVEDDMSFAGQDAKDEERQRLFDSSSSWLPFDKTMLDDLTNEQIVKIADLKKAMHYFKYELPPINSGNYDNGYTRYSITQNSINTTPKPWEEYVAPLPQMVNATKHINIPAGVTSIDAHKYFTTAANNVNRSAYFDTKSASYQMVEGGSNVNDENGNKIVPGLFSGYYKDFPSANDNEKMIKGNDHVESISMVTVTYLPPYAFDSCEQLERVTFGKAMENIGIVPFRGCAMISTVLFHEDNEKYFQDNGIIYSHSAKPGKEGTYVIEQVLATRGSLIMAGRQTLEPVIELETDPHIAKVGEIIPSAFAECTRIMQVLLGDAKELQVIPKDCFSACDSLNRVDLPETVRRIEEGAFGLRKGQSVTVFIPGLEVFIETHAFDHSGPPPVSTIETYEGTSAEEYGLHYKNTLGTMDVRIVPDNFRVDFLKHNGDDLTTQRRDFGQGAVAPNSSNASAEDRALFAEYLQELKNINHTFIDWNRDFSYITKNTTVSAIAILNDHMEKVTVNFRDWERKILGQPQSVSIGQNAIEPYVPPRRGYIFDGWDSDDWKNVIGPAGSIVNINALYKADDGSGGSGNGNGSNDADEHGTYTVSVSGGSGSGRYAPGAIVTIAAYASVDSRIFDRWTTASTGVGFQNANSAITSFTMPGNNVTVTATYRNALSSSTGGGQAQTNESSGSTDIGGGDGSNTTNRTNTTVLITKPGIPNHELASATVSGALDDFVIRISDSQSATDDVISALLKHYGDISNIRYFPMDISLYDASGIHKITDTTGLSITITMPLPNDQVPYGGSNRVASALGGTLEHLNPRFSMIDNVPCVTFTTTHFSPYVIYADLDNLHSGIIDDTPKTGDGIHPKWFLVIGLVSVAMILFLKKEKAVALTSA
ncbi:MAG: leucine-rich repeat protein [Lachnospiraceae bacterium]|nr:leucine-rich repeat protein [Lachnospiraceae bacterium]